MNGLRSDRIAFAAFIAATLLAGCGGLQPPAVPLDAMPPAPSAAVHADRSRSWMLAEARADTLLYVSDNSDNVVYAFSYPQGTLVGTLTGFDSPVGICVNPAGSVWIVNQFPNGMIEYDHGGSAPKRKLALPRAGSYGCAVDPKTGDIALTGSSYSIAVFKHGRGHATIYSDADLDRLFYCGYDDKANLFCSGQNAYSEPELAELPAGAETLDTIALNIQMYGAPGAVQWDSQRRHLIIAEQAEDTPGAIPLYHVKVVGSKSRLTRTTTLNSPFICCGFQGWLQGDTYVNIYYPSRYSASDIALWSLPKGGNPTKVISIAGSGFLWGCAVSLAPRGTMTKGRNIEMGSRR
jgi:hypothetical protein